MSSLTSCTTFATRRCEKTDCWTDTRGNFSSPRGGTHVTDTIISPMFKSHDNFFTYLTGLGDGTVARVPLDLDCEVGQCQPLERHHLPRYASLRAVNKRLQTRARNGTKTTGKDASSPYAG